MEAWDNWKYMPFKPCISVWEWGLSLGSMSWLHASLLVLESNGLKNPCFPTRWVILKYHKTSEVIYIINVLLHTHQELSTMFWQQLLYEIICFTIGIKFKSFSRDLAYESGWGHTSLKMQFDNPTSKQRNSVNPLTKVQIANQIPRLSWQLGKQWAWQKSNCGPIAEKLGIPTLPLC